MELAIDGDRAVLAVEDLLVDATGLVELFLDVERLLDDLGLAQEHLGEVLVLLGRCVDALEGNERRHAGGVLGQHGPVVLYGAVQVAQLALGGVGGSRVQADGEIEVLHRADLRLDGGDETRGVAENPREALDVSQRPLVGRILVQGANEGVEGPLGAVSRHFVELGDLVQQLDLLAGLFGVPDEDLKGRDQLGPVLQLAVDGLQGPGDEQLAVRLPEDALQGAHGLGLAWILDEDVAIQVDRDVDLLHLDVPQSGQSELEGDGFLGLRRLVQQLSVDVGQLGPLLQPAEQALEGAQRLAIGGVEGEDVAVAGDGVLGAGSRRR